MFAAITLREFALAFTVRPLWITLGLALAAAPSTFAQPIAAAQPITAAQTITARAGGGFEHRSFMVQSSQFTSEFDAKPTVTTNAGIGMSADTSNQFADTSTFVRFNPDGSIDARNGSAFAAAAIIPYHSGLTYHFREDVDIVSHTYSVFVRLPGNAANPFTLVGMNFAFRDTANTHSKLASLAVEVTDAAGTLTVNNFTATSLVPPVSNPDCTIIVPEHPLTAAGLATPYRLTATNPNKGPCHELDPNQSAFVSAAIIDTDTGQISVYAPLVIDNGTQPAVLPVVPVLPAHYVAALHFGYNGTNLRQAESAAGTLANNNCVNGFDGTLFTQFSYCNAVNFFAAANQAIALRQLVVPAPGNGLDGFPCPMVRSFAVVDQDQSDNVTSSYLKTTTGQFAVNTAINRAALIGAIAFANPSDNRLVDVLLDGGLGCTAWKVPDLGDAGALAPGLVLNELQAQAFQLAPIALMPLNDPMTQDNGAASLGKTNAYRLGVGQPQAATPADASGTAYCANFRSIHPTRLVYDKPYLTVRPSPFPNLADSLWTFMIQRENATYILLGCQDLLHEPDRITPIANAAGVVIGATIAP
ncbi:MAG TPA: hypothetical protein VNY05_35755 [Candidatus Acidoferrales bacterium]|nr:hypothetical protein [Candidatus Acidoferrales bacterium]